MTYLKFTSNLVWYYVTFRLVTEAEAAHTAYYLQVSYIFIFSHVFITLLWLLNMIGNRRISVVIRLEPCPSVCVQPYRVGHELIHC